VPFLGNFQGIPIIIVEVEYASIWLILQVGRKLLFRKNSYNEDENRKTTDIREQNNRGYSACQITSWFSGYEW